LTNSRANSKPGRVFWITGLSAAGKTSIGRELSASLRASGCQVIFLDGDTLRAAVSGDLGYSAENRRAAAMRNGRLCRMLAEQGFDVVCSTISLFHDVQRWNRENIPGYHEIFVRVPLEELKRRDTKGVYSAASDGRPENIVGLDIPAEIPQAPDLIVDNDGSLEPEEAARLILESVSRLEQQASSASRNTIQFGTKAETLERLAPLLRSAAILPQVRFSVAEWRGDRPGVLQRIATAPWGSERLIVRSSAMGEDSKSESKAGKFTSVSGVEGAAAIPSAVERVIASYAADGCQNDQILVQPMLHEVSMAGVAVTREPHGGGPYFVINYDDYSGRCDLVTSGTAENLKTFICLKSGQEGVPGHLQPILDVLRELESLLACDAIDVEFAVGRNGAVYLLQVRPLALKQPYTDAEATVVAANEIAQKVALLTKPHPYLHGNRSVFGGHARLEPRRNHRTEAPAFGPLALQRTDYGFDLGLSTGQLRIQKLAQLSSAHDLSRAALHRCPRELQFIHPARHEGGFSGAAGQLLHRAVVGATHAARQGRVRDCFFVLHAGSSNPAFGAHE
jgi:adenylylsulfate kinase-like enzyme